MHTSTPATSALSVEAQETLDRLRDRAPDLRSRWQATRPFHYLIVDDFLPASFAEAIHESFPRETAGGWERITYTHQKKKLTRRSGFPPPIARFFALAATPEFRALTSDIVGIKNLLDDPDLIGGGLHQIVRGGFLDVHTDYNFHPHTKLHRRLNILLYMNKGWRPEFGGYLELWNMAEGQQLECVEPAYNRVVVFETNEVSHHGHPTPLTTPDGTTRNSLALYYYTKDREVSAPEHNTMYEQTTGLRGRVKTLVSSVQAASERVRERGVGSLVVDVRRKVLRRIAGLPPENK